MLDAWEIYNSIARVRFILTNYDSKEWGRMFRHNCKIQGFANPNCSLSYF